MNDWIQWRKIARERIIAARLSISEQSRQKWSKAISFALQQGFPNLGRLKIGLYWPFRGEYDPREAVHVFKESGAVLAMPKVITQNKPLEFYEWWQDAPMVKDTYDIPVPLNTQSVQPDVLIIPMVGFDQCGYRLGYGGGYYDRTLSTLSDLSFTIGVAFELQRLDDLYPQPHDISMHYIVTEAGIFQTNGQRLEKITIEQCAAKNSSIS